MSRKTDNWQACPEGTVGNLVQELRTGKAQQDRRRSFLLATAAAMVLVCATGYFAVTNAPVANNRIVLACGQVKQCAAGFLEGTLSEEMMVAVRSHLEKCPGCDQHIKKLEQRARDGEVTVAAR